MIDKQNASTHSGPIVEAQKRPYAAPVLRVYGLVAALTKNGQGTGTDGGPNPTMEMMSDRRAKESITRVGTHPLGIGLYLFNYKLEQRDTWGHGRQFGVMADEVETVMPEAVSLRPDGHKMVRYGMLGISRVLS